MEINGECSKPKKSKCCSEHMLHNSQWTNLPSVVLYQIFDLLSHEDRKNASLVCRHWRNNSFHSKWWPSMKFKIHSGELHKLDFITYTFGKIVSQATISLDSQSSSCIYELIILLRLLSENNHLKSFLLEPSHCRIECLAVKQKDQRLLDEILDLIIAILPRLDEFSLGCVEDLAEYKDYILRQLNPNRVKLLGLASIKNDSLKYEQCCLNPDLMASFKNLKVLSIDYDHLSDSLLNKLDGSEKLERLVVHLHKISKNQEGTTNGAWRYFKEVHPSCLLRLTLIHAHNAIEKLPVDVLREEMPLSHIKVLFCENVNMEVLHSLSQYYKGTLRSVIWIDSLSEKPSSWKFSKDASPDPFVLMAWLCSHFEELILYGYKYSGENLVAIGRLRGSEMKKLEIPEADILYNQVVDNVYLIKDITKNLRRSWSPLCNYELHPVIHNPVTGDSDEFLLPLVLQDLH
ncbi:F-box only protein 33 [Rhynchophorus ferrugineus]|uniref:F-box only protein 33 n=1 Tax=Rhynchophorus ferrugineus TaxID=354439 RepID=UPI003FCD1AA8